MSTKTYIKPPYLHTYLPTYIGDSSGGSYIDSSKSDSSNIDSSDSRPSIAVAVL